VRHKAKAGSKGEGKNIERLTQGQEKGSFGAWLSQLCNMLSNKDWEKDDPYAKHGLREHPHLMPGCLSSPSNESRGLSSPLWG
jgi:hypothetical protein